MLNVVLKRIEACSRDVLIEETHVKEKYETKNDELVFKAQNLIDPFTKIKTVCLNNGGG